MKIKDLLLKIINNEELPERVIYDGCWYDLTEDRNYCYFDDLDYCTWWLFEGDIFNHLDDKVEVIWKLERVNVDE